MSVYSGKQIGTFIKEKKMKKIRPNFHFTDEETDIEREMTKITLKQTWELEPSHAPWPSTSSYSRSSYPFEGNTI